MHDLVICGGSLVDGTGAPAVRADIGVAGGRVVAIGPDVGVGRRKLDADGLVVSPGFIDIHTHFDVQAFWDPLLDPSPMHGITTVIGGNCGFSVAPVDSDGADFIRRMLARVEGMPLKTLEEAVPWNWRSTADHLGALETKIAPNAGFYVGHSALRRMAMGVEASEREALPHEIVAMQTMLAEGLAAGGLGFSTSRGPSHHDGDGLPVPSRHAAHDELIALARVCREHVGTSVAYSPSAGTGAFDDDEIGLMIDMSLAARRPLNWNLLSVTTDSLDLSRQRLSAGTVAQEHGARVVGLVLGRNPGSRYSVSAGVGLDSLPGWAEVMAMPHEAKLRTLQDPRARRRLEALAATAPADNLHRDWGNKVIVQVFGTDLERFEGRSAGDIGEELGSTPFDAFLDIVCADELRTSFRNRPRVDSDADWAARAEVLLDSRALIGASDAGAHLDMVATFDYPSVLLSDLVRERGLIGLERAVHMLTGAPAELLGLSDRGRIALGSAADLVVFDPAMVGTSDAAMTFDLPGGAGRLRNVGHGIEHVLVNGVEIVTRGAATGSTPGRILRSGIDTRTASM